MVKYGSYKLYYNKRTHEELRIPLNELTQMDFEHTPEGITKMASEIGWIEVETEEELEKLKRRV